MSMAADRIPGRPPSTLRTWMDRRHGIVRCATATVRHGVRALGRVRDSWPEDHEYSEDGAGRDFNVIVAYEAVPAGRWDRE